MMIDRQGTGLTITRVCIGVFFLAEGISKYRWFSDSSMLVTQLSAWLDSAGPGSFSARYDSSWPSHTTAMRSGVRAAAASNSSWSGRLPSRDEESTVTLRGWRLNGIEARSKSSETVPNGGAHGSGGRLLRPST